MPDTATNDLLSHLNDLHTTEMGVERIKRNLSIDTDDIVNWCREKIRQPNVKIFRKGKNYYINIEDIIITVNSYSYTIITAHRSDKK